MGKVLIMIIGLMFFSLVAGASYPAPFTTDNTATIVGNGDPTVTTGGSIVGEANTLTSPTATTTQTETDKELFSKEDICRLTKGCWINSECFPRGYRAENVYCGANRVRFINQSSEGDICDNSFECKSNFCFNGKCVDTIKTVDDGVVRIDKSDLEELRSIIEDGEKSMEEGYDEEVSKNFFSSLIGLFKRMFGL